MRLGFTGTLPKESRVDMMNIMSFTGPVWKEYKSGELADGGYMSKCNILVKNLEYIQTDDYDDEYVEIVNSVFHNTFRINVIRNIIREIDHNVLILVGKVESEGKALEDHLISTVFKEEKEIIFLSGKDKVVPQ